MGNTRTSGPDFAQHCRKAKGVGCDDLIGIGGFTGHHQFITRRNQGNDWFTVNLHLRHIHCRQ
jgi:hypothetical protein